MCVIKNNLKFIVYLSAILICLCLSGCASVPSPGVSLPTYNIGGIQYVPLLSVCSEGAINWDYDLFTKVITLEKDLQKVVFRPEDKLILINGREKIIDYPAIFYKGMLVLPLRFKEEIIDTIFKKEPIVLEKARCLKIKRIVIDPGHGGHDPGAIGKKGLREKEVVLDIARRLARYLETAGVETILTRSTDIFIPLSRRIEIANRKEAQLFVSIHANANPSSRMAGFEVYCLSSAVDDASRALEFSKSNYPKLLDTELYHNSLSLKAIVWDMIYASNYQESLELAQHVCRHVNMEGLNINGIKAGAFYVLKWTKMPAILVEVGYLSNPKEEQLLKNSVFRQEIARQIADGILEYCEQLELAEAGE